MLGMLKFDANGVALLIATLRFSFPATKGYSKLTPHGSRVVITEGIHGPLIASGSRLDVLWREQISRVAVDAAPTSLALQNLSVGK